VTGPEDPYLAREAKARKNIDRQLAAAGWVVQHADRANVSAGPGVAVREFVLERGHGRVDYLLFVDGQPAGVIEAKLTPALAESGGHIGYDVAPPWRRQGPGKRRGSILDHRRRRKPAPVTNDRRSR
jgi:hypothetical protein